MWEPVSKCVCLHTCAGMGSERARWVCLCLHLGTCLGVCRRSPHRYLLSTNYVLDSGLGPGEIAVDKTESPAFMGVRVRTALDCHTATPSRADESYLPFCHVMAGRGAPDVSQARTTDMPSITVLSRGPLVMLGAMPAKGESGAS